ncbi:MAG: hypothetical protein CTY24_10200 [Methylobacter sp.]|nr:MAG: hypothetical protein CTY24_10200 [Methylobacter sp.]
MEVMDIHRPAVIMAAPVTIILAVLNIILTAVMAGISNTRVLVMAKAMVNTAVKTTIIQGISTTMLHIMITRAAATTMIITVVTTMMAKFWGVANKKSQPSLLTIGWL